MTHFPLCAPWQLVKRETPQQQEGFHYCLHIICLQFFFFYYFFSIKNTQKDASRNFSLEKVREVRCQ